MNAISTKVVKLDINFILDNFHRPALWDKKWTIFEYDGYTVTFQLQQINTQSKSVYYELKLYRQGNLLSVSYYNSISVHKDHRNIKVIQQGISGRVIDIISYYEMDIIKMTTAYREAEGLERDIVLEAREKAEALLDELSITNDEIREAYIDAQESKHKTSQYTSNVLRLYQYKKTLKLYYAYALYSGEKPRIDKFKEISKLNGFKVGALRKEIKEQLDLIEKGDFKDTLEMDKI